MEMLSFAAPLAALVATYFGWRYITSRLNEKLSKTGFELRPLGFLMLGIAAFTFIVAIQVGGATWLLLPLSVFGTLLFISRGDKQQVKGGAADVINDAEKMKALAEPFEPEPYIKKARARGRDEIFLGLNQDRKPIFFPRTKISKNHIEILGESGVGKSSLAGVLLSQLAAAGECVVIFDPKADRMLPGVLARAGQENGFPVTHIDLRFGKPAQLNPFFRARRDQVEELLQVALDLGKTGHAGADFYRGKDREATSWMASAFEDGETSMPELLEKAGEDERVVEQENLWREFRQIARIPAFQVHQDQGGHDLEKLLSNHGVIYITGSTTRLEVQAGQKLLLQRILQVLDERLDQSMPVAIFLDELKYILSPASLRAAGTIRDRNCHLIFAHQSLGDLSDCPGLDPKAVRGAVWGNCGLKIVYKMQDAETARELSLISGERAVLERRKTQNDNGVSVAESIGKASHMPLHTFTHLPKPEAGEASVGVILGDGVAYFVSTRWLPSGPTPEPIAAAPLQKTVAATAAASTAFVAGAGVGVSGEELLGKSAGDGRRDVDQSTVANEDADASANLEDAEILAADFDDLLK